LELLEYLVKTYTNEGDMVLDNCMGSEGTEFDKKSLRVVTRTNPDWDELACDCVAFANARGGRLLIGIEDEADEPPVGQVVDGSLIEAINKRIPQITINTSIAACKKISGNGGEFIELTVRRNAQTVAATTDGRYFIRVSDESRPLMPDELTLLSGEKNAYVWEVQTTKKVLRNQYDEGKLRDFMAAIQKSDRVSGFVKAKTSEELLDYYFFSSGQYLTNLGILWIGRREDRATLLYAPVIQFIKYDELENKVNKLLWDDFELNPLELIESVWDRVPDWRESYELPDGLFRKNIPQYDELVVRELLANALVHKPYTQRGDIFINLHSDRLEIHNPGLLPLGVTPSNILHATVKRNEHMARIFYDLRLMEREGSGYDRIYEALVTTGRPVPEVREGDDRVMITVRKRILNPAIIDFMFKADQAYEMTQKEKIALGLIAQHEAVTAINLCRILEIRDADDLKPWIDRLCNWQIVKTRGRTKATEYYVDPELLRKLDFKGKTSLKGIEKHRLRELVIRDLEIYKESGISEIHKRIGAEIPVYKLRRELAVLANEKLIVTKSSKRWKRYLLNKPV
jgi:ATP-dependent DNA helicase RecG